MTSEEGVNSGREGYIIGLEGEVASVRVAYMFKGTGPG